MARRKRNRSSGKIDRLPEHLKDAVEQMLLAGKTYREIVAFLKDNDQSVSQMSVCRFAEKYLATVEMLQMSQENFRMMSEEVETYPNLDTTEVIMRIASQQVLSALTSAPAESWEGIDPDKLLKNGAALIRAAAYKRKTDGAVKTDRETALEANKSLLFDVLAKKHPSLYKQVMDAVNQEQALIREAGGGA
jgi:hypothetical protein